MLYRLIEALKPLEEKRQRKKQLHVDDDRGNKLVAKRNISPTLRVHSRPIEPIIIDIVSFVRVLNRISRCDSCVRF